MLAPDLLQLLERCLRQEPAAQRALYDKYAYTMLGVCLRYAHTTAEAEDLLQDAFVKVFTRLKDFRNEGSLEGWIRRIVVTTAIDHFHKERNIRHQQSLEEATDLSTPDSDALDRLSAQEVLKLIKKLPEGCRMVLNLYAIEGYNHGEISEMLGVKESTSKAQLCKARKMLVELLQQQENYAKP